MPTGLGRGRQKPRKTILTPDQAGLLIKEAKRDLDHGVYYAFPFLAGTRPSEQLGLLWSEVDFEKTTITSAASRTQRVAQRDDQDRGRDANDPDRPAPEADVPRLAGTLPAAEGRARKSI